MNLGSPCRLPAQCPLEGCASESISPKLRRFRRKGFFIRNSDSRRIQRFFCGHCRRSFSSARFSPCFRQRKRKLNHRVAVLLFSGVSQRRAAFILHTTRSTIIRKFLFQAKLAKQEHDEYLKCLSTKMTETGEGVERIYFDEMESFERSKCLPLSIPLAVNSKDRKILGFRVCSMPAKGHLAEISRRKYGFRLDERPIAASDLWSELKPCLVKKPIIVTDENPFYPSWIAPHFPQAIHQTHKGRRGCVVGQGELKAVGFDPMFELNHTAAMLRANINRLFRRTWCTTKRKDRLLAHIYLYARFHNQYLT